MGLSKKKDMLCARSKGIVLDSAVLCTPPRTHFEQWRGVYNAITTLPGELRGHRSEKV